MPSSVARQALPADAFSARSPHELSHKECRRWAVNQTSMVRVLLAESNVRTSNALYFWLTDWRRKLPGSGQFRAICVALERGTQRLMALTGCSKRIFSVSRPGAARLVNDRGAASRSVRKIDRSVLD